MNCKKKTIFKVEVTCLLVNTGTTIGMAELLEYARLATLFSLCDMEQVKLSTCSRPDSAFPINCSRWPWLCLYVQYKFQRRQHFEFSIDEINSLIHISYWKVLSTGNCNSVDSFKYIASNMCYKNVHCYGMQYFTPKTKQSTNCSVFDFSKKQCGSD